MTIGIFSEWTISNLIDKRRCSSQWLLISEMRCLKNRFEILLFATNLFIFYATMAQEVERRLGKAEVTGSSPVSSSSKKTRWFVSFLSFFIKKITLKVWISFWNKSFLSISSKLLFQYLQKKHLFLCSWFTKRDGLYSILYDIFIKCFFLWFETLYF